MTQILGNLFIDGESIPLVDRGDGGYTITNHDNLVLSTVEKKFGNSSMYWDEYSHLSVPNDGLCDLVNGEAFTFDTWIKAIPTTSKFILEAGAGNVSTRWCITFSSSTNIKVGYDNSRTLLDVPLTNYLINDWNHIAFVRFIDGSFNFFINGLLSATKLLTGELLPRGTNIGIGCYNNTNGTSNSAYKTYTLDGYMDNIRIVKGQALWTENFDLTEEALFYKSASNYVRPGTVRGMYNLSSKKGNLRGKAKAGFVRPTIGQFFTSRNFEDIESIITIRNQTSCVLNETGTAFSSGNWIHSTTTEDAAFSGINPDGTGDSYRWTSELSDVTINPKWLGFQFYSPKIIKKYTIWESGNNQAPKDFLFQGSNNGADWVTLDSQTNITWLNLGTIVRDKNEFEIFNNTTPFTYYRIYITDIADTDKRLVHVSELEMFEVE